MAGLVEEFCLQLLPKTSYDFLLALSEEYQIVLDNGKKDEKAHVLKMVMRYLTGETLEGTGDGGAAVFLKLYKELGEELKKEKVKLKFLVLICFVSFSFKKKQNEICEIVLQLDYHSDAHLWQEYFVHFFILR